MDGRERGVSPLRGVLCAAVVCLGCSGQSLDAGSSAAPAAVARATLANVIDAITMDDQFLYFTCEDGWLYRLSKSGTEAPKQLAQATAPGSQYTEGIAVDDAYVYWTAIGDSLGAGRLARVSKSGDGSKVVLASQEARPAGVVVDDQAVYWVDTAGASSSANGGGLGQGSVQSMPKGGGPVTVLAGNLVTPDFLALDDNRVVWHDATGVRSVPKSGGKATTLLTTVVPAKSSNLVGGGGTIYFAVNEGNWALVAAPTAGGSMTTLAGDITQPGAIAVAGGSVFWNDTAGANVGAVRSVPTGGGRPGTSWPANAQPGAQDDRAIFLLVDAQAFYSVEYWATSSLTVAIRVLPR